MRADQWQMGELKELTIWEEQRGQKGPNIDESSDPFSADPNPDGGPPNVYQLRAPRAGRPPSEKHPSIHAG